MKPDISKLKEALTKFDEERSRISKMIRAVDEVPRIKALVGKYFKYVDSNGSGKYWFTYLHVTKYKDDNLSINSFSEDGYKTKIFEVDRSTYPMSILNNNRYIEITEKEYKRALEKILKNITNTFKSK